MATTQYSGNWGGWLEYSSSTVSQNIAGNSSVVKVDVWIGCRWDIQFGNTYGNVVSVTVNDSTQNLAVGQLFLNNAKKHLGSVQFTVPHNADGTKTASISVSSNMSNISYGGLVFGNASASWNHGLSRIPRSSSISVGTAVIGSSVPITIARASGSFTHTVRWHFGNQSGTVASNVGTSTSWAMPLYLCEQIPNNVSGTGTIYVDTYSGSTKIGTTSVNFTATVPDSIVPRLTSISVVEEQATAKGLNLGETNFIQIISKIKATINGASGIFGSTIKSTLIEIQGKGVSSTSNPASFTNLNFNGAVKLKATVTDSRGRKSAPKELSINLLEYFAPVASISAYRTRENPDKIQVLRTWKIAPLAVGGVQKNKAVLKFRVAPLNSSSFVDDAGTADATWTAQSSLTNSAANLSKSYATNKSWTVEALLSDIFTGSSPSIAKSDVSTETAVHAYDKDGRFGVGKTPELGPPGSLDAKGKIFSEGTPVQGHQLTQDNGRALEVKEDWNSYTASGIYMGYNLKNSPPSVSGTHSWQYIQVFMHDDKYSVQQAVDFNGFVTWTRVFLNGSWKPWIVPGLNQFHPVGSIYESTKPDNPATFMGGTWERFGNGRVLVGVSENEAEFNAAAKTGGEKAHKLTIAEMPRHSHRQVVTANNGKEAIRRDFSSDGNAGVYDQGAHTAPEGGDGAHNNLQPFITVYRWRRTA